MVAPVSGPHIRNESLMDSAGWVKYDSRRTWYRQKKPFNLPLEYHAFRAWGERNHSSVLDSASTLVLTIPPPGGLLNEARSKAWARFLDKLGASAELGTSLAEGRQAVAMMSSRVLQLARFAKAVNRFDIGEAARSLNLRKKDLKDVWYKDRTRANLFLEAHFGWEPLIRDVYSAMDVLQSEPPPTKIIGKAITQPSAVGNNWPPKTMWSKGTLSTHQVAVRYGAEVRVSNPNLALANQLGLVNPLQTALEVVPWSFVLGWFVNLSQVLGCWSDLLGYSTTNHATTTFTRHTYKTAYKWDFPRDFSGTGFQIDRVTQFTLPGLYLKPFRGLSVTRAATAVALLIQNLPRRPADVATPSLRTKRYYTWKDFG